MKINRHSPFAVPVTTHKHHQQMEAMEWLRVGCADRLKDAGEAATSPLMHKATQFIEERYQLVVIAGRFTVEFENPARGEPIRIPISPAIVGKEVLAEGQQIEGWSIMRGFLILPRRNKPYTHVTLDLLVGWAEDAIPHLIRFAISRIVSYWLENPAAAGVDILPIEAQSRRLCPSIATRFSAL